MKRRALLSVLLSVFIGCARPQADRVELDDGPVVGRSDGRTRSFLGIPFANPPTGALRFAPPERVTPWTEDLPATRLKPICAQLFFNSPYVDPDSDEDCLSLNVWAPTGAGPFPVMVFVPGGDYTSGSGTEDLYNGRSLSEAGQVVVITLNYRLGPLGFSAISDGRGGGGANFGILDQREALRWVQRNVSGFGGDPSRVTLWGESAGAGSVCMHLVSPGSAGLFQSAILESAPCTSFDLPTPTQAAQQSATMANNLGCTGDPVAVLDCLRAATKEKVMEALPPLEHVIYGNGYAWTPTVDGEVIPDEPVRLLEGGASAQIPILIGANANEGTYFFSLGSPLKSEADMRSALSKLFTDPAIDRIIEEYGTQPSANQAAINILSDMFTCDARRIARLHASSGGAAYLYRFELAIFSDFTGGLGSFHGSELPFVFGNGDFGLALQAPGLPLLDAMQGYWSTMARTGNPNGGGRPRWPLYGIDSDGSLLLDLQSRAVTGVSRASCDFWDSLRN